MKKGTETSSFGVSAREGHNADKFYQSNLYKGIELVEVDNNVVNQIDNSTINKIYAHSSENMIELPDNSVHLMTFRKFSGVECILT